MFELIEFNAYASKVENVISTELRYIMQSTEKLTVCCSDNMQDYRR